MKPEKLTSKDIIGMNGRMLLLACCAPCCVAAVEFLAKNGVDATLFFYNPNIHPREEYEKRKREAIRVAGRYALPFVEGEYEPAAYDAATAGFEGEPERGARCSRCFFLRLSRAAEYARENGYDGFSSTLGFSRWKNPLQVDEEGKRAEAASGTRYLPVDWRREGLQPRARELIREQEIYEQKYCGCRWSMNKKR
ncbi:MAG: epoxyqueuosine reductase QueH [Rickettsiales bacterium]|nr:epoxyqueuosine reductase QueH [Rickettsiales bacterium]